MSDESTQPQQQFATLLRRVMADRNLKVKEVAAHIGVSPGAVSQWRAGHSEPTPTNIRKLADALGYPAGQFYAALAGAPLGDPTERVQRVPEWASDLGNLSAETVRAIRMLIEADQRRNDG